MTSEEKPKKKRRRRKKNHYFTDVHELAIIQYNATNDNKIRSDLYVKFIGPAFSELVDKIIYTYKFTNLPNIDVLKDECKIWLATILEKYDPSNGSKAFSYFSVITKNWFSIKRFQTMNIFQMVCEAGQTVRKVFNITGNEKKLFQQRGDVPYQKNVHKDRYGHYYSHCNHTSTPLDMSF